MRALIDLPTKEKGSRTCVQIMDRDCPPSCALTLAPGMHPSQSSGDEGPRHDHPLFPAGVQVAKLQGCGHFAHQEKPREVNALLLAWFARHEG